MHAGVVTVLVVDLTLLGDGGVANSILLGTGLINTRIQWLADPGRP